MPKHKAPSSKTKKSSKSSKNNTRDKNLPSSLSFTRVKHLTRKYFKPFLFICCFIFLSHKRQNRLKSHRAFDIKDWEGSESINFTSFPKHKIDAGAIIKSITLPSLEENSEEIKNWVCPFDHPNKFKIFENSTQRHTQVREDKVKCHMFTAGTLLRRSAGTPLRRSAGTPLRRSTGTPLRRYVGTPLRGNAGIPLRRSARTPLRRSAETPLRRTSIRYLTFLIWTSANI